MNGTIVHTSSRVDKRRLRIGFLGIADFRHLHGREVIASIQRACEILDLDLLNFSGAIKYSVHSDVLFWQQYRKIFAYLNRSNIDGLITWASSLQEFADDAEILALHRTIKDLPIVAIGAPVLPKVAVVYNDPKAGVRQMMEHLVKHHGFERIAFIGPNVRAHHRTRFETYRESLEQYGLRYDESLVVLMEGDQRADTLRALAILLDERKKKPGISFDAILCISDNEAMFLIEALKARGIDVPDDVAVTGYNNQLPGIQSKVPITTVDFDPPGKNFHAVQLLLSMIQGAKNLSEAVYWPSSLVIRESCGCFEETIIAQNDRSMVIEVNPPPRSEALKKLYSDAIGQTNNKFLSYARTILGSLGDNIVSQGQKWIQDVRDEMHEHSFEPPVMRRMGDILHQVHGMVAVFMMYRVQFKRADEYLFMSLGEISVDFASAGSGAQLRDAVKRHLHELGVPGMELVLFDEPGQDITGGRLSLLYHESDGPDDELIPENAVRLPKGLMYHQPRSQPIERRSRMFEILHYNGQYFGYAVFEMGSQHIPLYDTLRLLLSHSLHGVYLRESQEGKQQARQAFLGSNGVKTILESVNPEHPAPGSPASERLINYLVDHLHEETDLSRIAEELNMSRSSLMRLARERIGHPIQQLHERMKIERAKMLLTGGQLKINEVAERLGYQNPLYFSRVFRKQTGLSPRDWVKQTASV